MKHNDAPTQVLWPLGSFLKEEMQARGWNTNTVVVLSETPRSRVLSILAGQPATEPEIERLAQAFNVSAEFFSKLQSQYVEGQKCS